MKAFSFLLALSLFIFPAAIAQQINEGSITQMREQFSLYSIPVIGGLLATLAMLGLSVVSVLGLTGVLGTGGSILSAIALLLVGVIAVLFLPVTIIILSAGLGIPLATTIVGVIGTLLSGLGLGGIVTVLGTAVSGILGLFGLGGAGVAALGGGFSLFAGGTGALTGLTLFCLNVLNGVFVGFPLCQQFLVLCITPLVQISLSITPLIDALCQPFVMLCIAAFQSFVIEGLCAGLCGGIIGGLL